MATNNKSVFNGWNFIRSKDKGANESGEYGGVYKSSDNKNIALIKKENSISKNIAEFLGSQIFEAISPQNGAKVSLIAPDTYNKSKSIDSQIYVKSKFFENYSSDMYEDMDKYMSPNTRPSSWFRKDGGRPLFVGSRNKLFRTLENAFKEVKYQNFENIMPASLLIGDFDVHIGNIGVIREPMNPEKLPKLVRIDFAGSLNKLTDDIYPHSRSKHLPGFGPTNHFREFPSALRTKNLKFADSLIVASKIDLTETINKSFNELTKYYSNEALEDFARQAMPRRFNTNKSQEINVDEIKTTLINIMKKRQESLKQYGLEIKISNLISKHASFPYYKVQEQKLKTLIQEHPDYFEQVIRYEEGKKGGKNLVLRNRLTTGFARILEILGIRKSAKKHLIQTIKTLSEEKVNLIDYSNKAIKKHSMEQTPIEINRKYNTLQEPQKSTSRSVGTIFFNQQKLSIEVQNQVHDLLKLDEEDLKQIKNLKEKVMQPMNVNPIGISNKKSTKQQKRKTTITRL